MPSDKEATRLREGQQEDTSKLQGIFELLPDAAFVLDVEGKVVCWNNAAELMTGTSKADMLGKADYSIPFYGTRRPILVDMFDCDISILENLYENVRRNDGVINAETYIPHLKNNNGMYIWIAASLLYDAAGRVTGAIEVIRDISEQRRLLHSLSESEYRFKQLTNHINEVFFLLDNKSRSFLYVSDAAERIIGYSPDDVMKLGAELVGIIHPDDRDGSRFAHPENRYNASIDEEFRINRPDGKQRWLRVRTFPISNDDGEIERVAGVASDITIYKVTAANERQHREMLIQTDKMASLGILVSGVAHEINNPNNYITLSLPMLRMAWDSFKPCIRHHFNEISPAPLGAPDFETLQNEFDYLLTSIRDGATRIQNIVSDLKAFARSDSHVEFTPLDLNDVVKAAVQLTGSFIKKATSSFLLELSADTLPVHGMFQRLEQVVINLIQNACDALTDCSKGVLVRTELNIDGDISLYVKDEGCGIAPDNLSHITDPFFTTKRDRGGTGLGLSVSAGIIKEHGGTMRYTSVVGKGTEVHVVLPGKACT